jgi:hypothetical protein
MTTTKKLLAILKGDAPLDRETRNALIEVLERYAKAGRPRCTPEQRQQQIDNLVRRWKLVEAKITAGSTYDRAMAQVAMDEGIKLSSFKKDLPAFYLYDVIYRPKSVPPIMRVRVLEWLESTVNMLQRRGAPKDLAIRDEIVCRMDELRK